MATFAYRFVPIEQRDLTRPSSESAQYTITLAKRPEVGDRLDIRVLGRSRWEVVEVIPDSEGLLDVRDVSGTNALLAGSLFCRPVVTEG